MPSSQPQNQPVKSGPDAVPAADGPAAAAGTVPSVEPAPPTLEEQLAAAKKEAAGNYDRYLRAVADLENHRRRAIREKEELRQYAATNLLQHLLPVLDNLQLGLAAARQQTDTRTIADGVAMVLEQFREVLGRHGLKEVNPLGQKFDPHLHESLSHQPSPEVPEEHVLQVARTGYTLHGRLLRPASVILSSGPAKEAKG
ncbi:MAG: nucleotide exchange factor GrpE [Opitutaceae bacterium]|nr:nucleotide exchange factor GrpE [Opitutaceae bacterium]